MSTRPPPHLTAHSTHCAFSPPFLKLAAPGKQLLTTVDSLSSQNRPENRSQSSNPRYPPLNFICCNFQIEAHVRRRPTQKNPLQSQFPSLTPLLTPAASIAEIQDIPKRWKEGTRGPCRFICKHCLITDGSTSIRQHHRQCSQCQQSKPKCKTDRPESQLIWKRKQDRCLFVR